MNNKKSLFKNSIVVSICFFIQTILGFFVRKKFIDYLGIYALGYNAVFTNILTVLNLSELGIGISANAFLYKSLSNSNIEEITAISKVLKKLYSYVCLLILIIGVIIAFFLPVLIPKPADNYLYIYLLYILTLVTTITSYMMAYRKNIVSADQKNYVVTIIDCISYTIISLVQIYSLIHWKSYILYLILGIIKNIISSIVIYIYTKKRYRYLDNYSDVLIEKQIQNDIISEMKNIFVAKIGGVVFHGTDNIIISSILGSVKAGFLSNYTMITNILQNLIAQIFSSIQSTLGSIIHKKNSSFKEEELYQVLMVVAFIIGLFSFEGILFVLPNMIVSLFGQKFLLSDQVLYLLAINCLLMTLLQVPNQIFAIYKLYRYDKYIVMVSALFNIVISILLVFKIGIEGVLVGTTIALLIYLISRCLIVKYKVYSNIEYKFQVISFLFTLIVTTVFLFKFNIFSLCNDFIKGVILNSIYVITITSCLVLLVLYFNKYMKILINSLLKKLTNFMRIISFVIIVISIFFYYESTISNKKIDLSKVKENNISQITPSEIVYLDEIMFTNFTSTGFTYDLKNDTFWIADHGTELNDKIQLFQISKDLKKIVSVVQVADYVNDGIINLQGIAYDAVDDTIWVATGNNIQEISKTGGGNNKRIFS